MTAYHKNLKAIYCLLNQEGQCLYVGSSCQPYSRLYQHHSITGKAPAQDITLVILRWCIAQESGRLESQVIRAFKRQGQASLNKTTPDKPHNPPPPEPQSPWANVQAIDLYFFASS